MSSILPLLILAAQLPAPMDHRYAEAIEVYTCDFERASDSNYDHWPDGWTRRRGRDYPLYVKIRIADDLSQQSNACLRIDMDGGAATVYSPPIEVSPLFSYVLEGQLLTRNIEHDETYLKVTFYDKDRQTLATYQSARFQTVDKWQRIRIGPMTPNLPDVRFAVISLHVEPTDDEDLEAVVSFDDIWFALLPRMTLRTNSRHNVYHQAKDIVITCELSGISEPNPTMDFQLADVSGKVLASQPVQLVGQEIGRTSRRDEKPAAAQTPVQSRRFYAGQVGWNPPIPDHGFYTVRASVQGHTGTLLERSITLALVQPMAAARDGEFGWTIPGGEEPLPLMPLLELLSHVGVSWVKFPVWFDNEDTDKADRLAWFAERLSTQGIEMVGMLDQPPEQARLLYGENETERIAVAQLFVEPELWQPLLNPILTRLSLKVRWWQLGSEQDASFVGYAGLAAKVREIKKHMERFGQEIKLGFTWQWMHESPADGQPPWSFLSKNVNPPFTPAELRTYLTEDRSPAEVKRWIVIEPLSAGRYDVRTRAHDLVARMLAAKMANADGVFLPDPFSSQRGVMKSDGTPGELLLPWRTTAFMIAGSEFVGSISMPEGSSNYIFTRDDHTVMAVWNDRPVRETLYLGEDVKQVDLWGRVTEPESIADADGVVRQVIAVGSLPSFITGINLPVARWRIGFSFDRKQLSSSFGREQVTSYTFRNYFPDGVSGDLKLNVPKVWTAEPLATRFKLAGDEQMTQSLRVLLRADASTGAQPVRVDFHVRADRLYKFSVYSMIHVGLGDLIMDVDTHIDRQGNLIVEQHLTNKTDRPVSFNSLLFSSVRRRIRKQVLHVGRGRRTEIYVLPDGRELVGKTLSLRAEEIGGLGRILNHNITVKP